MSDKLVKVYLTESPQGFIKVDICADKYKLFKGNYKKHAREGMRRFRKKMQALSNQEKEDKKRI